MQFLLYIYQPEKQEVSEMHDLIGSLSHLALTLGVIAFVLLFPKIPQAFEAWTWKHGGRERTNRLIKRYGIGRQ